jgi:hypothetical protein
MRSMLYILGAFAVVALAYWAYKENYATQEALRRVKALEYDIGTTREELNVLRAEWAYLNRPERLRELAELNYDALQLQPLSPDHFGDVEQVDYPRLDTDDLSDPVDTMAEITGDAPALAADEDAEAAE